MVLKHPAIQAGMADGVIVVLYMLVNRGVSSWSHSVYYSDPISWSGSGELLYNTFGFQWDNIATRLKEFFMINFTWIFTFVVLIGIVWLLWKKRWKKSQICAEYIAGIIGILASYGIFMCLYITSGAIRYNVVFTLLFTVLGFLMLVEITDKKVSVVISVAALCLMAVQNFYSIDVVTNALFRTVEVGNTKLLCISQESHRNPGGDYYVTNLQYRTISSNFQKMFQEIQLTEKDVILIAGENYVECTKNASLSEWNGRHNDLKWDREEQRYRNTKSSTDPMINTLTTNKLWGLSAVPAKDTQNLAEQVTGCLDKIEGRIYVYFSPLFQSEDKTELIEQLGMVFDFGDMQKVSTNGNVLEFCELYKKDTEEIERQLSVLKGTNELEDDTTIETWNYNRNQQKYAVEFIGDRRETRIGDTLAVTIACYENDSFLNLGYSPKGTVLTNITLGNGNVLPGIEDALLGATVGESVEVTCTFPKDYRNNPEVRGRTLVLKILINSIEWELQE